eukprot:gnl/TRDRNA2_/TRDRNA2_89713_c1_seq1.p1 gnl/TRDRNA2_/TRDRNA2_89713_c1~~gnl/TRDRNA2_/TRDRNA2_89713_c1_seq1.p1  ORF type:complete len:299 (-),score=53.49 gnl/TRDRNA2_/TRDRNA2_89713_c1_seq1:134-928(-)
MVSDAIYESKDRLHDDFSAKVPDFMRIMLANRIAKSGKEWVDLMTASTTGTYSSQWMVIDYKLFNPGDSTLQPGTFWVLEQVPGLNVAEDKTQTLLDEGFWSSENRAWFKDTRDSIGQTEAFRQQGDLYSHDNNPRAKIFKLQAPHVNTLDQMKAIMELNRWPDEPAFSQDSSLQTPDHAIASRNDLASIPSSFGGTDAKVTDFCLATKLMAKGISGPSHDTQAPFHWSADDKMHDGQPETWNFDWVHVSPDGFDLPDAASCPH